jgi:hypothetical protein
MIAGQKIDCQEHDFPSKNSTKPTTTEEKQTQNIFERKTNPKKFSKEKQTQTMLRLMWPKARIALCCGRRGLLLRPFLNF